MYYKEEYVGNKGSLRRGSTKHVFFMLATGCPEIKLVLGVLLAPKIASQLVEYIQGWVEYQRFWRMETRKIPFLIQNTHIGALNVFLKPILFLVHPLLNPLTISRFCLMNRFITTQPWWLVQTCCSIFLQSTTNFWIKEIKKV